MGEHESSFAEKIRRLSSTFLAQVPERLGEVRRDVSALHGAARESGEVLVSLRRTLHSLKGTSRSLGFADLGERAEECEAVVDRIIAANGKVEPVLERELLRALDALEEVSKQPLKSGAGRAGSEGLRGREDEPEGAAPGVQPEANPVEGSGRGTACEPAQSLVYVCDDDPLQGGVIAAQLGYFGYRIQQFSRTDELRTAIERERPAVVVMDIMFPDGRNEGSEVLTELRARGKAAPAVFVSGRRDFEARIGAIRAGGVAYFPKPVDVLALADTIDSIAHPRNPDPFRILIVDDDHEDARYHQLVLESAGMTVVSVDRPETVLDVVSSFRPDLVLMDMYMPGCSGREVAALIRQIPEFVSLPIIYLSGETDRTKQLSAMSVGVEGFLTKPIAPVELVSSVSLRADRMRTLHSLMSRDSLTGLYNHTTTTELLRSSLVATGRANRQLCFAMIDLDNFKLVNDTWGHPVGDQVLLAVAKVLRQRLRGSDHVGRYGGEEFAVILSDVSIGDAARIMESIREDFARVQFHAGEATFSCTFSCGIAQRRAGSTLESLRAEADSNLYRAKDAGRNAVVMSSENQKGGQT